MPAYLYSRFPVVSQTFCDTEMLALEAAGYPLVIGSLNPPPNSFRHERLAGLKAEVIYPPPGAVLDLPLQHPPPDPVWQAMSALAADHAARYGEGCKPMTRARNAWHFAREFRRRGVKHIHVHFANRATHTALFLKKAGFTFSFTAHAQDFMVDLGNDDLLREMIREAEFTVAVSEYSRGLLVALCPERADRIHRVYNGIDASRFPKARPDCGGPLLVAVGSEMKTGAKTVTETGQGGDGLPRAGAISAVDGLRLVSIGRLIPFKGFAGLLEAVRLLRDRGIAVSLQIIGDGPEREALEKVVARDGSGDCVQLRGVLSQEQIKVELAACHAFVLACVTDSKGAMDILPTVILEAMACGLPVVSTTLAGVPEMVVHGETGLLARPGDAVALADHLETLAGDPLLRARMGEAGLARVETLFSLESTAGGLARLFPGGDASEEAARLEGSLAAPAVPLLCLLDAPALDAALHTEVNWLLGQNLATVMATRLSGADPSLEYLPDATVLEAAWRSNPALAAKAEALRPETGSLDGELFFVMARRAVHLAGQVRQRGWQRVHALRANTLVLAWMVHRLTGLPASATVEATHQESRSVLAKLLPAFTQGSNSDSRLKCDFPDLMRLQAPATPNRLLGIRLSTARALPADPVPVWQQWLQTGPADSSP